MRNTNARQTVKALKILQALPIGKTHPTADQGDHLNDHRADSVEDLVMEGRQGGLQVRRDRSDSLKMIMRHHPPNFIHLINNKMTVTLDIPMMQEQI